MKIIKCGIVVLTIASLVTCPSALSAQGAAVASDGHKVMAMDVGTWKVEGKMWMPGSDEPMPFEATETNKMMGEVHLISDFHGDFAGMEFKGHGTVSYDPESKVYSATWIDVTETALAVNTGTWDEKSRTLTMMGKKKGMDGSPVKTKGTVEYKEDGTRLMTMYSSADGNDWHKDMELLYTKTSDEK